MYCNLCVSLIVSSCVLVVRSVRLTWVEAYGAHAVCFDVRTCASFILSSLPALDLNFPKITVVGNVQKFTLHVYILSVHVILSWNEMSKTSWCCMLYTFMYTRIYVHDIIEMHRTLLCMVLSEHGILSLQEFLKPRSATVCVCSVYLHVYTHVRT